MRALPTSDELWSTWLAFLAQYGSLEDVPDVGVKVSWERRTRLFRFTKDQLFEYVRDFVAWRRERGLRAGLGNGLPLLISDSAGECLGPQEALYAEFELVGLGFELVPGSETHVNESSTTSGPAATWWSSTGPMGGWTVQGAESERT